MVVMATCAIFSVVGRAHGIDATYTGLVLSYAMSIVNIMNAAVQLDAEVRVDYALLPLVPNQTAPIIIKHFHPIRAVCECCGRGPIATCPLFAAISCCCSRQHLLPI
jgi:hypothetical protein